MTKAATVGKISSGRVDVGVDKSGGQHFIYIRPVFRGRRRAAPDEPGIISHCLIAPFHYLSLSLSLSDCTEVGHRY